MHPSRSFPRPFIDCCEVRADVARSALVPTAWLSVDGSVGEPGERTHKPMRAGQRPGLQ